jgi:two-component system, chemotaxis family, CheB/CheR fusion protein
MRMPRRKKNRKTLRRTSSTAKEPQTADTRSSREKTAHKAGKTSSIGEDLIQAVSGALRKATGVDFSQYKRTTLVRRIERRMAVHRLKDPADYVSLLSRSSVEARALHDEILIHVTSFFRDPEAFDAVESVVLKSLVNPRSPKSPIRVWVPGCSTGEEVYSLAMTLCEFLEERRLSFPLQIFGTDISEKVVAHARLGKYADPEVPPEYLRKYFTPSKDGCHQVNKALRELCVFASHDICRDPPYSNLDLISCRNVLIYFNPSLQERVIPVFHYALNSSGFLLLGPSESIASFEDLFAPMESARHIFSKKSMLARLPADMLSVGRPSIIPPLDRTDVDLPPAMSLTDISKEADRAVLVSSAPGVIISEGFDILQFRGDVGPFLTPSPGKASFNLAKMAHEGLLSPVSRALERAKRTRVPVVLKNVSVKHEKGERTVQVQVIPLSALSARESCFLVLFADPAAAAPKDAETLEDARPETRERHLERELRATRRALESIIEKQQTTNEELQSANEELRSRNEEYQSSLEELQTTQEELRSANEELTTLNDELRNRTSELDERNSQLAKANEELRKSGKIRGWLAAIVDSSDDAIISKDLDGVITSWNAGAARIFGYAAEEAVGKPVALLIPPDRIDEERRILEKIRRGERIDHFETVRRCKDGKLLDISLTISPIVDDRGGLIGISKVARNITDRKRADHRLERMVAERTIELRASNEELEAFCYAVAHDLRAPLRSIRSFSQLIRQELTDHPQAQVQADLQRIVDNAGRMSDLIDGLLNLSRLTRQEMKVVMVDLSAEAEAIVKDLKRSNTGREARFVVKPRIRVRGDAGLLRALLQNLLENSWKFTAKHPRARIEFGEARCEGQQAYFVRDDGAGFDPAYIGKLFNPFQRLHHMSEFPGTGIGLATAKRIVLRHGGRIWAESVLEKGATFYFTISPDVPGRERGSL